MIKYKGTFNQKFDIREVMVSLTCGEDEIEIISEDLSKNVMRKLAAELVYDGYAENVEVEKGVFCSLLRTHGCVASII